MKLITLKTARISAVLISMLATSGVYAGAIHDSNLFTTDITGNDDGSTGAVNLGFSINFFGTSYSTAFVNNNGNVTFQSANGTYLSTPISGISKAILAPFYADVDTRTGNSVKYGTGTIDGHNVFGVNWINVGYYNKRTDKLNSFQLIITDRNDTGVGNFDFEFNYDKIQWETGDANGGIKGLGGDSAVTGWSDGAGTYFEYTGSRLNGSLLDGGQYALTASSAGSNIPGHHGFSVRNSLVNVPEPTALILLSLGALAWMGTIHYKAFSKANLLR
jgi:hypothetical protein